MYIPGINRARCVKTGVPPLDYLLPEGVPLHNFITLSGEGGTGKSVILQQLAINFLRKGFSVVYVASDDSPLSIMWNMKRFGWNVERYLRRGRFKFVDCFSFRIKRSIEYPDYITVVEHPQILRNVSDALDSVMDKLKGKRVMLIDSLTDMISHAEPMTAIETVKSWRANYTKAYGTLVFTSFHFGIKAFDEIEQIIDYIVDGIIDLRFDPYLMQQGVLVKQMRVRKMKGVPHLTKWVYFQIGKSGLELVDKSTVMKLIS